MVAFLIERTPKTVAICANDWSSTGINQFLYFTHQHSGKHIDTRCQVTFGFKYIFTKYMLIFLHNYFCADQPDHVSYVCQFRSNHRPNVQ